MATYESIHTGQAVDQAVDRVLLNKSKGDENTPIYLDANGEAQAISKDVKPIEDSVKLVESGGVYTELSNKYNKADISTDPELGVSPVVISSEGAIKTYTDETFSGKQDNLTIGEGLSINDDLLSIDTADYMTENDISGKRQHFSSELPYGTNSGIVEKMSKAKHSTFDRSKFTVVGSPIITSDGIASGFSASNYLTISEGLLQDKTDWELIFQYNTGTFTAFGIPLSGRNTTNTRCMIFSVSAINNIIYFYSNYVDNTWQVQLDTSEVFDSLEANTDYWLKVVYRNGYYTLYVSTDGTEYISCGSAVGNSINDFTGFVFGRANWSVNAAQGSIDLKQFSITVDGVEVFSGNKTGIDTIKPDDYEVPSGGSLPTITADGIASNFSATSYLEFSKNITLSKDTPFAIYTRFKAPSSWTKNGRFFGKEVPFYFGHSGAGNLTGRFLNTNLTVLSGATLEAGKEYDAVMLYDGTKAVIKCKLTTETTYVNKTLEVEITSTDTVTLSGAIGNQSDSTDAYFTGSIDLNATKIYVNGDLVYQPCLKIPYTQTKDGKKIVDSIYRDRVEDECTQAGFTPYYTLDENSTINYSLGGTNPPTVTDGIVSGFSTTGWVQIPYIPTSKVTDMEIEFDAIPANLTSSDYQIIFGQSATNRYTIQLEIGKNHFWLGVAETTSAWVTGGTRYYDFEDGVAYHFKIIVKNNSTSVVVNNTVFNNLHALTSGIIWLEPMRIGVDITTHPWQGTFDLNSFTVKIDGKLVYQPVIPPNYTMQTVKPSDLVDFKTSGSNMYRQYANQTIEQYGTCTETTPVTFEKPFMDTNYTLTVPYLAKTTTGFTPDLASGVTRSWKATGKVSI